MMQNFFLDAELLSGCRTSFWMQNFFLGAELLSGCRTSFWMQNFFLDAELLSGREAGAVHHALLLKY